MPVGPALIALEDEVRQALAERHDELVHRIAVALVEVAAAEHTARNGTSRVAVPRLCRVCRIKLAATNRNVCNACRRREQRERERLRQVHADELKAISNGARGARAAELMRGARRDPAQQVQ